MVATTSHAAPDMAAGRGGDNPGPRPRQPALSLVLRLGQKSVNCPKSSNDCPAFISQRWVLGLSTKNPDGHTMQKGLTFILQEM